MIVVSLYVYFLQRVLKLLKNNKVIWRSGEVIKTFLKKKLDL